MTGERLVLKTVVDAGVPALVFFAMVVVGMELTADDFRRVARHPGTLPAAIVGQFVFLPFIGWLLVGCLNLRPAIAGGAAGCGVPERRHGERVLVPGRRQRGTVRDPDGGVVPGGRARHAPGTGRPPGPG